MGGEASLMILARFEDACRTGRAASRRLSCKGIGSLGVLRDDGLLPDALRRVVKLGTVHPDAQARFLRTWTEVAIWSEVRAKVGDDDLFFAALRLLLPPPPPAMVPQRLWRGQREGYPIGMSWTRSFHIAASFAQFGTAFGPQIKGRAPRADAVILFAMLQREIICVPWHGHREGEYIVDPRGIQPRIDPAPTFS
jgi:hypothetical protein